jgi:lysophospholipid acyltransferase (LPLAT)-like uncharacterized protein
MLDQWAWSLANRAEASARHRPTWALAESAAAHILEMYMGALARRGQCACVDARTRRLSAADLGQALGRGREDGRPLVIAYWVADAFAIMLALLAQPELREFLQPVRFLLDDTVGGRLSARFIERFRGHHITLKVAGDPTRLKQLRMVVAEGGSCAFAVDGGGPYFEVGTGTIALAVALGACVLPLAAQVHPAMPVAYASKVRLPLPGCRTIMAIGAPIPVSRSTDRARAAASVRESLVALRAVAQLSAREPRKSVRDSGGSGPSGSSAIQVERGG